MQTILISAYEKKAPSVIEHLASGIREKNQIKPLQTEWLNAVCLLARASGLLHDIGKNNERFQAKLWDERAPQSDEIRHEWLSMKLLQAMRGNGRSIEAAWADIGKNIASVTLGDRVISGLSRESFNTANEAIDYLIVTHHGLLRADESAISASPMPAMPTPANHIKTQSTAKSSQLTSAGKIDPLIFENYWETERLLNEKFSANKGDSTYWKAACIYARAALIFSDHTVSSQKMEQPGRDKNTLYANTKITANNRLPDQTLDWHLRQVGETAARIARNMAQLTQPTQPTQRTPEKDSSALAGLDEASLSAITTPSDPQSRFAWQNHSAHALEKAREETPLAPALIFNMAGTGSGKTRMNVRAACALSKSHTPRIAIALNLRSLTLQTGQALKTGLGLGSSMMATVIGDALVKYLFNKSQMQEIDADENKEQAALDVVSDCEQHIPEWMAPLFKSSTEASIVAAPVLVSTVDFLIEAGNPDRQGRHVKALLRLMTSDLVLDEIDSYEPEALAAVLRLVQMSAFFGKNIICSSATLALPVARSIEKAYRSGRLLAAALTKKTEDAQFICGFIDDELPPIITIASGKENAIDFECAYEDRLAAISATLEKKPAYRMACLQEIKEQSALGWQMATQAAAQRLHRENSWEYKDTGKRVSFGLVRMANILPAIKTARFLSESVPEIYVACYHAQDFLIARFQKERRMDGLLSRAPKKENPFGNKNIEDDKEIEKIVRQSPSKDIIFIIVATPVEEIGRDHDFDWGVIDASSAQSIVQTAGRINRHRLIQCDGKPNIAIMRYNYRHCENIEKGTSNPKQPKFLFVWPGFESIKNTKEYGDHDLGKLLPWNRNEQGNKILTIDARLRFDKSCLLSSADDKAITHRLAPFFGEEKGVFVQEKVSAWAITDGKRGPYAQSMLRDKTTNTTAVVLTSADDRNPEFKREVTIDTKGYVESISADIPISAEKARAWLISSPSKMTELCDEFAINHRRGMRVEISNFEIGRHALEYDYNFGMVKVSR